MSDKETPTSHPDQFIMDTSQIILSLNGRACTTDDMREIMEKSGFGDVLTSRVKEATDELNRMLAANDMITNTNDEPNND